MEAEAIEKCYQYQQEINNGLRCPYCLAKTELIDSIAIYAKSYGFIYRCKPCDAYVGCHGKTTTAKGSVANHQLRELRKLAHSYFDPLWKRKMERDNCTKTVARNAAYIWLAEQMNLHVNEAHIGMFDLQQCNRVIEVCKPYYSKTPNKDS